MQCKAWHEREGKVSRQLQSSALCVHNVGGVQEPEYLAVKMRREGKGRPGYGPGRDRDG